MSEAAKNDGPNPQVKTQRLRQPPPELDKKIARTLLTGQKILGASYQVDGSVELHFDKFVVFAKTPLLISFVEEVSS